MLELNAWCKLVSASLLYYCAGIKEEGEKEKETSEQFRRRNRLLITCKRVPL